MISKKERRLNSYAYYLHFRIIDCRRKGTKLSGKNPYYFRKQLEEAIRRGADIDKVMRYW